MTVLNILVLIVVTFANAKISLKVVSALAPRAAKHPISCNKTLEANTSIANATIAHSFGDDITVIFANVKICLKSMLMLVSWAVFAQGATEATPLVTIANSLAFDSCNILKCNK